MSQQYANYWPDGNLQAASRFPIILQRNSENYVNWEGLPSCVAEFFPVGACCLYFIHMICSKAGVLGSQGALGSSLLVLESRRACWGPHSWSWRAAGCAGVLTPGPGEPQGVLGSSLLVLESRRACWGPHSWSWRAAGRAGVLTPGPGEPQGVRGSSLLVLESRRVCWGPHSWSWRAAGCAGVLTPGPGEPQGVLGSSLLVLGPQGVLGSSLWTGFRCYSAFH